ncbi:uncharacterized protein LOC106386773 isoform X4 [Brassica napus]|uniref:uncharacterized protein LOC106386773 isoform X4 n=1 Tax=Brassica napus TaxID=3708 RepID=UPI00207959CA|nr:uncharacterized protein LOC106386773 isoform X4 [Brassica napus]
MCSLRTATTKRVLCVREIQMTKIEKLQFPALEVTGANYTAWITNMELHQDSDKILETIKESNISTSHEKARAVIFLRRHLDENLTHDYARIKDPLDLWKALKERFDNQKKITLPHALDEWKNLRFQDFEKVETYNSAILRIAAQLDYCGKPVSEAEMLEKTYQTFHKNHYVLQEQYRNCVYMRFSELAVTLIIAERNNELLRGRVTTNENVRIYRKQRQALWFLTRSSIFLSAIISATASLENLVYPQLLYCSCRT